MLFKANIFYFYLFIVLYVIYENFDSCNGKLLSNAYKRSFVEFHVAACDVLLTQNLLGDMVKESYLRMPEAERPMKTFTCPVPPGNYSLADLNFNLFHLPETFPFQEGRAYVNFTRRDKIRTSLYLDFVMKLIN